MFGSSKSYQACEFNGCDQTIQKKRGFTYLRVQPAVRIYFLELCNELITSPNCLVIIAPNSFMVKPNELPEPPPLLLLVDLALAELVNWIEPVAVSAWILTTTGTPDSISIR